MVLNFSRNKGRPFNSGKHYIIAEKSYIIHTLSEKFPVPIIYKAPRLLIPGLTLAATEERKSEQWLAIKVKLILQAFEKTSTPFCPPKPKELEIAAPIFTARA